VAITTLDGLIAAPKRRVQWQKTASVTTVANIPYSVFDQAGTPGAGTMDPASATVGYVPTDATAGYPPIVDPSNNLYVSRIHARSSVACWLDLYDTLWTGGQYGFATDVTIQSTDFPSYAGRIISSDYGGTEIWLESSSAFTGNQTIQINYIDQDGNAGDTGAIATAVAPALRRMYMVPLAAGDSGVRSITRIRSSVSTIGQFNVHIMRWLWSTRINGANQGVADSLLRTGLAQIFGTSALRFIVTADSTASGLPSVRLELSDG
jgi:hypothetical protein